MMTKKVSVRETPASKAATASKKTTLAEATQITVHYDAGFPNIIYIRGQGGPLSWDQGLPLENVSSDEWVWKTKIPFKILEFKVLINDIDYEVGSNHILRHGTNFSFSPKFS